MRRRAFVAGVVCALVHGALMALTLPPLSFWPGSLVTVFPAAWAGLSGRPITRWTLLGAWVGAVPLWAVQQWWTLDVSALGFFPLVGLHALYLPLFVLACRVWSRVAAWTPASVIVPVAWVGVEYFRGNLFLGGYAWGFVGHPLIDAPMGPGLAAIGGEYLASLYAAVHAGLLVDAVRWRGLSRGATLAALGAVVVICALMTVGLRYRAPVGADAARFGVVQTNVPQSNKIAWTLEQEVVDFERFQELTLGLGQLPAAQRPQFVVWPETMMPGLTLEPEALNSLAREGVSFRAERPVRIGGTEFDSVPATAFVDVLLAMQQQLGVPMLVGEEGIEGLRVVRDGAGLKLDQEKRFNSVYLVEGGRIQRVRYDKVRLTPFGETMPVISRVPWLEQRVLALAATGMRFDLAEGEHMTVFNLSRGDGVVPVRAVTPICFEVVDAPHCRRLVFEKGVRRADVIVNLTNDGWFGESGLAREQHLQLARWRCAELATPMVRSANTGISAFVDARGKVVSGGVEGSARQWGVDGVLVDSVRLGVGATPFARTGDLAGLASVITLGVVLGAGLLKRAAQRRAAAGPGVAE